MTEPPARSTGNLANPASHDISPTQNRVADAVQGIRAGALESLRQGIELLSSISTEQFTHPCPHAFNATIGQHYRHCLDHFDMFFRQFGSGEINYDLRERHLDLEACPAADLRQSRHFESMISQLDELSFSKPIRLSAGVGNETINLCSTTLARELYYVTAHTIHHFALIAVIGSYLKLCLPRNFGVAPSTVAYLATHTKA